MERSLLSMKIEYFFHISADARNRYGIDSSFYSIIGNIIIADFVQARILSAKINDVRRSENRTNELVTPGLVNAAALLHELFHFIIREYDEKQNPGALKRTLSYLRENIGDNETQTLLEKFTVLFPPLSVYNGEITSAEFLSGYTLDRPNSEIIFEEMLLLYLENYNPALAKLKELFDETPLKNTGYYEKAIQQSVLYFESEKPVGISKESLIAYLLKPIKENPQSIDLQLKFIMENWNVSERIVLKILGGMDLVYEDSKLFVVHGLKGGSPEVPVYNFYTEEEKRQLLLKQQLGSQGKFITIDDVSNSYLFEEEQFTEDTDWMPRVVMIAKNAFVWLDQLSKKYGYLITTLDRIPDAELDTLNRWHYNALWLIGVWERSPASKKVKQFCGNHDAVSSAYSLFDYEIAADLGGYDAYINLRDRCKTRHIRLASDMVPNHTGIYSKWIMDNPDYFVQSANPPYPGYTFYGPNLSENPDFEIRIEDKYYSRQDAAVVFQLKSVHDRNERYIYHGNDGTNMPWNDTAQLNLLMPAVREALYQKIKRVSEMFPIIRFDAAMTLTKRHYQRLWFPQPGTGGAIPSRADHALSKEQFDAAMPTEFWRDVVDRMNAEMPDTLLLAEAFWLMEGYFVRTLGMHRVYNSAFMHMFMKEENQKYRELIKNTIEFNPEILKRYVNFMSNPDEETAVNQFGKGDKYFGVCVMMITLPGLPMFAHGQIEGFTEKYGMEYQRAYYQEIADQYLIERHEREIFPLTLKRYLFCDVKNFWLYDFVGEIGGVNQNVIAFSNMRGNERVLVLYNNAFGKVHGKIQFTTGKVSGDALSQENSCLIFGDIISALRLNKDDDVYYIAKDTRTNQEHLWKGSEIAQNGFYCTMAGYEYKVFINISEVRDKSGLLYLLYQHLNGSGTLSVLLSLNELRTAPLHLAVMDLFNTLTMKEFYQVLQAGISSEVRAFTPYVIGKICGVVNELSTLGYQLEHTHLLGAMIAEDLRILKSLQNTYFRINQGTVAVSFPEAKTVSLKTQAYNDLVVIFDVVYLILTSIIQTEDKKTAVQLFDELMLAKPLWQNLIRFNNNYEDVRAEFNLLHIMLSEFSGLSVLYNDELNESKVSAEFVRWLEKKEIQTFIGINVYRDITYFNKENFELLVRWYYWINLFFMGKEFLKNQNKKQIKSLSGKKFAGEVSKFQNVLTISSDAIIESEYDFNKFLEILKGKTAMVKDGKVSKKIAGFKNNSGILGSVKKVNPEKKNTAKNKKISPMAGKESKTKKKP